MNMPIFLRIGHGIKDGTENINMNSSKKRVNLVDNQKSCLSLTKTIPAFKKRTRQIGITGTGSVRK